MNKRKKLTETAYKELLQEWHTPYNQVLEISLEDISEKSQAWVYWKCPVCGSIYRMSPGDRVEKKERRKESCFTCRGRVQYHRFII